MRRLTLFAGLAIALGCAAGLLATDITGNTPTNTTQAADIHITGKIDQTTATLTSTDGSIFIDGKIDGGSSVTLRAAKDIEIGQQGGDEDKKIDGRSVVSAVAGGHIIIGSRIDGGSVVHLAAGGGIDIMGKVDNGATRVWVKCGEGQSIHIHGKVDGGATIVYWPPNSLVVDDKGSGQNNNMVAQDW